MHIINREARTNIIITMILNIAPEFGYALITAVLVGFECLLIGFLFPGRLRSKIFSKKYLEENFSNGLWYARGRPQRRLSRHGLWEVCSEAQRG